MDAIFDVSFIVPAVIFTFLAIILATSIFGKKADPESETIVDDAPVEEIAREGDELQHKSEKHKASQSEVNRIEEITAEPESDVPAVAPVVEKMGTLEKEPVTQSEIPPAQQELEKSQITESVAEIIKKSVSETLSVASRILESEPPPLEKKIVPEPMNLASQVGFAPAPKPVPVLEAASEPEPVPEALAEAEPVAQVVLERKNLPEVASVAATGPTSVPEVTPTAAAEPASIPEVTPTAAAEPASIPEVTPTAAAEPASIPEVTPTAAAEPAAIPEVTPTAAPEEVSILETSSKLDSEQESVPKASPTDSVPEPILDPLSKTTTSIPEDFPESAPAVASLEDILQMAAEPGPAKEEHIDAVVPSSSDGDAEPLKYVSRKLRTSQLEKLMTKEELEEEQRMQQKQLAAIFQLLRNNKETFGEVTEGDVTEQLKLYSK
nr:matrix-remodeling-associated protein 7 isoform X2 [Paramormyrops kingsleyae]